MKKNFVACLYIYIYFFLYAHALSSRTPGTTVHVMVITATLPVAMFPITLGPSATPEVKITTDVILVAGAVGRGASLLPSGLLITLSSVPFITMILPTKFLLLWLSFRMHLGLNHVAGGTPFVFLYLNLDIGNKPLNMRETRVPVNTWILGKVPAATRVT